jgi:hypothetical protein
MSEDYHVGRSKNRKEFLKIKCLKLFRNATVMTNKQKQDSLSASDERNRIMTGMV